MKIGVYTDQIEHSLSYGITAQAIFLPILEMMSSMHVICYPDHHSNSQKWYSRVRESISDELYHNICEVGSFTNQWMIVMDIALLSDFIDLDFADSIESFQKLTLSKVNKVFQQYDIRCNTKQLNLIKRTMQEYADVYFEKELTFIQPLLVRELNKIFTAWKTEGIAASINRVHERLFVDDKAVTFRKNKDYIYHWTEIKYITFTASIFLGPHLILGGNANNLLITQCFKAENTKMEPAATLVNQFACLGDPTRLKILKYIKNKPETTQSLAKKIGISEAAVSKQLKLLSSANFLVKEREGMYVKYSLNRMALDFLSYSIYEYLN